VGVEGAGNVETDWLEGEAIVERRFLPPPVSSCDTSLIIALEEGSGGIVDLNIGI
jgi:hypothetical protein